ncbi:MAG: NTP transferase domain-containing protein, partial [Bdellovibrionales bacterium]|nr:NTP transferase domain-containing protein [Bdellovibrionales bacterium]
MSNDLAIVVLAAGKGTRMGSDTAKVLARVYGKSLIEHVLTTCLTLKPCQITVVTGYQREIVESHITAWWESHGSGETQLCFALQEQQLGTGHAAKSALPTLENFTGNILITYGDIPLVKADTFQACIKHHQTHHATVSLISIKGEYDNWYGRVVRSHDNQVLKIVERKDCSSAELLLDETNSGIYVVDSSFLKPALDKLQNNNVQKEYYLTDIVEHAASEGQTVEAMVCFDADELRGVNTKQELQKIERKLMDERIAGLAAGDVYFSDPQSCFIDSEVSIGANTQIGPQVVLLGETSIGSEVVIEGCAYVKDSSILDKSNIRWGVRI